MGIRYLNRFLKENASSSIQLFKLNELAGKKIAVDISIYIYKFVADNTLIENIYLMLSIFRYYDIIPIFIFDGKPPIEKKDLLQKRKENKKEAENEYNKLKNFLKTNKNIDEIDKQEIINNMDMLKKNFININKNDIDIVKKLIISYGTTYYDAPGEADQLCAMLTIKDKVWACLSEDMDMFVYGCPRVIRYLSLLNHTAVLYDFNSILNNLNMSLKEFREICVLSGTDYNLEYYDNNNNTLIKTLKYFKEYYKSNTTFEFYEWLIDKYKNYIKDYDNLIKIYNMFDLNKNVCYCEIIENIEINNSIILKEDIKNILKQDGFLFPKKLNNI